MNHRSQPRWPRSPTRSGTVKPTCLIVARHHANEISSTNAAFQLAHLCATDPDWRSLLDRLNIILPFEDPDGAALHAMLASDPVAQPSIETRRNVIYVEPCYDAA